MIVKHLIVFSVVIAVACASNYWTVPKIIAAISNPTTDKDLRPEMAESLVTLSTQLLWGTFKVQDLASNLIVFTAPGSIGEYTRDQIQAAISDTKMNPLFKPHFQNALVDPNYQDLDSISVFLPALELLYLKKEELDVLIAKTTEELFKAYYEAVRKELETTNKYRLVKIERIVVAVPFDVFGSGGWGSLTPGGAVTPSPADTGRVIPLPIRTPTPSRRI